MLIVGAVATGANARDFATPTPHPSPQGGGDRQAFREIIEITSLPTAPLPMQHKSLAPLGAGHVAGAHEGGEGGVDFGGYAAALSEGA